MMPIDDVTNLTIAAAIRIHRKYGPGILESVYEAVLAQVLVSDGLKVERQLPVPITFEGIEFDEAFRLDLLVEGAIVVEVKSVQRLAPVHHKQVLTHLRLMNLQLGLLINFGEVVLKDGLHRIVNNLDPGDSPLLRVNRRPTQH